jgi:hypothetical protein
MIAGMAVRLPMQALTLAHPIRHESVTLTEHVPDSWKCFGSLLSDVLK